MSVLVQTDAGTLQGRVLDGGGALLAGVPFAAPPIGPLRLRPPSPVTPWTGVREATAYGAVPVQPPPAGDRPPTPMSEDCLTLNVWTPDVGGSAPVLVWVYGGGFETGSASPPFFDGARFMQRTGCVVVAANYRVGALGWLDLAAIGGPAWAGSSNLGLRDVLAALEWVRSNAAAIGGDPGRVTLAGESAGAFCVGALLAAPAANGLFRRAILQSGSTTRVSPRDRAAAIASDLLGALGVKTPDDLLDVPAPELLRVQREVVDADLGRRNTPGGRVWGVVHDGDLLPDDPQDAVRRGAARDVALLVGANRDEARLWQVLLGAAGFAPQNRDALRQEIERCVDPRSAERLLDAYERRGGGLADLRTRFLSDWIYRAPAVRLAADQRACGGAAHSYLFAAAPFGDDLGAFHAAELPFVFDALTQPLGPLPAPGEGPAFARIRDEMTQAWGSFVQNGDPGWASAQTRCFGGADPFVRELPDDVADVYAGARFRA